MKKILLGALALLLVLNLAACGGDPDKTTDSDGTADPTDTASSTLEPDTSTGTGTGTDSGTQDPESTASPESTDKGSETTAAPSVENAFLDVKETVYVYGTTNGLKIRESYSADAKELGIMNDGESLQRTGISTVKDKDGITWSRVTYYGKVGYASSAYLTTVAPFVYTNKNETVYVTAEQLNLRIKASPNADIVVSLKKGDTVERTGVSTTKDENGSEWSRLLYNGVVCYANSTFLSTKNPSPSANLTFEDKNDTVYVIAPVGLNLRSEASGNSTIVDTLPYGTALERTGLATAPDADGYLWSRVKYKDKVCYVGTAYLSTEKTVSFTDANEKLYVTADSLNMRDIPSLNGSKLRALSKGTEVICTGKATAPDSEGVTWYRVVYNNEVYYASAGYLSPTKP